MPKIKIDKEFYERVKVYAESAGYSSVDEFVRHCLEKELENINQSDDESVKERLQGLGYI